MDIAEVAKRAKVPASTLRFYEEKGLIASVDRRGLRRVFAPSVLDRLAIIALGQAAGFSLVEIGKMFSRDGSLEIDRDMLASKADLIDAQVRRLKMISKGLRHAAVCKAPRHTECPSFLKLMRAAAVGTLPAEDVRAPSNLSKARKSK